MKTTGEITEVSINFSNSKGKVSLDIDTKSPETLELLNKMKEKKLDIEIKRHRDKRSDKANRYFWEMLTQICELKGLDPLEDYKRRVKELGIFKITRIEAKDFKTIKKSWERMGTAWFCDVADREFIDKREFYIVFLYYGSSSFNTKQMARLIDGVVQDCMQFGIETKPQAEIEAMLKEWDKR